MQVEFLTDAQRRLQAELETRDAKIIDLQNQKTEIFDKMVQVRLFVMSMTNESAHVFLSWLISTSDEIA